MRKHAGLVVIVALSFWGCVTFGNFYYKQGAEAEVNKKWDEAISLYEKALLENPNEYSYRLALARVKFSASLYHYQEARKLIAAGKKEEGLKEYEKALSYDPTNSAVIAEMRRIAQGPPEKEVPKEEKLEYPVKLKASGEKIELKFTQASLQSIFQALGKHAGINILFDEQFKDVPISIDLYGKTFDQAVSYLCLASKNFSRVIDDKTIIIVPDTPPKRIQYEQNAIKVFYLSNINAQDIFAALTQMLRTQYRAPNIFVDKNLNTITVRDTPANIELAGELIKKWDKPKGEVVIDLEVMEVSRTKLRQIGVDLDQALVGLRYAGPGGTEDEGWYNLGEVDLGKGTSYQISLPTALVKFLESDVDTKVLAQPRLRGVGDEEIKTMVGQQIPIPQTTFSPIAAGGVSQQPIVSYQYQNVGLEITVKPKIHIEKEITLEIDLKITSLAGSGYADIPVIATREVKNMIRLRDGETNLLAGLLRDEERKTVRGIAGLKSIPIIGSLFGATDQTIDKSELVMTITPYIIRGTPHTTEDDRPVWVGLEGLSPSGRGEQVPGDPGYEPGEIPESETVVSGREPAEEEGRSGENQISLDPANFEVPQGREFRISVNVRTQQELSSLSLNLSFNPQVVRLKDVVEGGLTRQLGENVPFLKNIDNSGGSCTIGFSSPQLTRGFKGGGSLALLVFEAAAQGETRIAVLGISASAPTGQAVSFTGRESRVVVR
jgi:general secretion pathway protein D